MIERLIARASGMGIKISPEQGVKFEKFHDMLTRVNAKMILTRISDDPDEAMDRNYLDSIAPAKAILDAAPHMIADIGAGAGFPGIPLSIILPDIEVTLIDALGKRVDFLKTVISELGLNARAVHARAEDAARDSALRERFDIVTSRAVASLNVLLELALPLTKVKGVVYAYKGPAWREELAAAENAIAKLGGSYLDTLDSPIPGRDWSHVIVRIEKTFETPEIYPRRSGIPEKRPL